MTKLNGFEETAGFDDFGEGVVGPFVAERCQAMERFELSQGIEPEFYMAT